MLGLRTLLMFGRAFALTRGQEVGSDFEDEFSMYYP